MLAMIVVARLLGVADFGRFGVIRSTTDVFAILVGFGLSVTASKHVAELRISNPARAGRIIVLSTATATVLGGFLTALFWQISPYLATHYLNDSSLAGPLRLSSWYLVLNAWTGVFSGTMNGFEAFRRIAIGNACVGAAGALAIIAFSYLFGVNGTVGGYGAYYLMTAGIMGCFMLGEMRRSGVPFSLGSSWKEAPLLYRFSLPALIVGAIGGPVNWLAYAYTSKLPEGFKIIGVFSAARIIQLIVIQVGMSLHSPLLVIAANVGDKDGGSIERINILASWILGTMAIVVPICIPEIVGLVFGGKYQSSEFNNVVALTCLSSYVMMYKQGFNRVITVGNLLWWGVLDNVLWGLLLLGFVPLLSTEYGATGFAAGFALAYAVNFIAIVPLYLRLGIMSHEFVGSYKSLVISGLVVAGAASVLVGVPLLYRVGFLCFAAAGICWAFVGLWGARFGVHARAVASRPAVLRS